MIRQSRGTGIPRILDVQWTNQIRSLQIVAGSEARQQCIVVLCNVTGKPVEKRVIPPIDQP